MVWIQKKNSSSTRLNFSYAILGTKVIPENNTSLNYTDGGTAISIKQGALFSRAIIRAFIPVANGGAYDRSHVIGSEATYPRLLDFLDDYAEWSFNDCTIYLSDTLTGAGGADCRIITQSLPQDEAGYQMFDLTLEAQIIRT